MRAHQTIETGRVVRFISRVGLQSKKTAREYRIRLGTFEDFLKLQYGLDIERFFDKLEQKEFDVYEVVAGYHFYLKDKGLADGTIAGKIATVKTFLEYNRVPISNTIFRMEVRAPRPNRNLNLQALSKEMVRKIILEIKDTRLQSYVLLLAVTGMRAVEALSVRVKDVDWDSKPMKINLRREYTKTKQRYVYITEECANQLKNWKEYRQRERKIVVFGGKKSYMLSRPFSPDDFLFTSGHHKVEKPIGLYSVLNKEFMIILTTRLGLVARDDGVGKRHLITLHSFRRFVKSTISDLGYQDYSEWFIGHSGSTYYRKTEAEKLEIFRKIEPYLTFLDFSELEAKGADTQTQLEDAKKEVAELKKQISNFKYKDAQVEQIQYEFKMFKAGVKKQLEDYISNSRRTSGD